MPEIHSLVKDESKDEEGKVIPAEGGPEITISNKTIPEIDDFGMDDEIEMRIKLKPKSIEQPEFAPNKQETDPEKKYRLEIIEAQVTNPKESRKKMERMGLDKERFEKLQKKRTGVSPV